MPHQLLLGDCLDVLPTLADASVDSIVTDPPYSLEFMGKKWDSHSAFDDDPAFGYYLSGLIDGEGCFRVQRHERGTCSCTFSMKLRADDRSIAEKAKRWLGAGTIVDVKAEGASAPCIRWAVQDKEGCQRLVDALDKYPLMAKKALDYAGWREAVCEWTEKPRGNRWRGTGDQNRMMALKARIEAGRAYADPPWSGNGFQDWSRLWASEALRVLKPGGYILAFGGTRTYHRLASALEDAGFEIRDQIQWVFASGFPKHKSSLKPAHEPIVLARKPLERTVAANVLKHGVGALNIDACRVEGRERTEYGLATARRSQGSVYGEPSSSADFDSSKGRWPANLIHDGSDEAVAAFPESKSAGHYRDPDGAAAPQSSVFGNAAPRRCNDYAGDSGSAARFFYAAKASKRDRGEGNNHPTVKPTDLMRYLCRLVTPPGGTVLDPFMGSGSTGRGAVLEGFNFIGIEREAEYHAIAERRIADAEPKPTVLVVCQQNALQGSLF